jgi:protein-arginine kinase
MYLNTIKYTNIRERKLCIGDKEFEMVQKFKYLGAVIDDENNVTHTIQERIQSSNKTYANLQLIKSKDINRNMKMKILLHVMVSTTVVNYGF